MNLWVLIALLMFYTLPYFSYLLFVTSKDCTVQSVLLFFKGSDPGQFRTFVLFLLVVLYI